MIFDSFTLNNPPTSDFTVLFFFLSHCFSSKLSSIFSEPRKFSFILIGIIKTSMVTSASAPPLDPANMPLPIPIDLFVSMKDGSLARGELGFTDSTGNIIFKASRRSSPDHKKVLLDSCGNPLISMRRQDRGSWQGHKGEDDSEKDLVFSVKRTVHKLTRTELDVFLVGENQVESSSNLKVKGCPFRRSCTIYKGNSIVAQTSLMYKLNQIYVKRNRFRLTIFPGSVDTDIVVALVVIFLDS